SRAVSRLRGRRPMTAGGVAAAIGQVDRLLELLGAAPGGYAEPAAHSAAPAPPASHAQPPARGDALLLGPQIRHRLGPAPERERWREVSAVVVSRSRARTLELIEHLREAHYGPLQVIVVDNASPRQEVSQLARSAVGAELVGVRLEEAACYAEASN